MKPLMMKWDGDCFRPSSRRWHIEADKELVVGEEYCLVEHHERSAPSHRHYFALVKEAWQNLPEHLAMASFAQSEEHLRAYALISTGYSVSITHACKSKAEAKRTAALIAPMDAFSVVHTEGRTVTVYKARSQSMKAMDRKEFQQSKDAVLGFLASLIGVDNNTLARAA